MMDFSASSAGHAALQPYVVWYNLDVNIMRFHLRYGCARTAHARQLCVKPTDGAETMIEQLMRRYLTHAHTHGVIWRRVSCAVRSASACVIIT